jgi:hypothetical protein
MVLARFVSRLTIRATTRQTDNFRFADHPSRVVEPPVAMMGGENWVEVSRAEKGLQNDKQETF